MPGNRDGEGGICKAITTKLDSEGRELVYIRPVQQQQEPMCLRSSNTIFLLAHHLHMNVYMNVPRTTYTVDSFVRQRPPKISLSSSLSLVSQSTPRLSASSSSKHTRAHVTTSARAAAAAESEKGRKAVKAVLDRGPGLSSVMSDGLDPRVCVDTVQIQRERERESAYWCKEL